MKRIFIIQNTPLNEPLPLSVYLTDLLRNFKKSEDFEINLIIAKSNSIPEEIKNLCNKIYEIEGSTYSIKDNFKFSFKVNKILKKENKEKTIDIVHCFYPNSSLLGAVLFKKFKKNIKIIYDVRSPWIDMSIERGFINKRLVPIYRWVLYREEKFLCKRVNSFMFITQGLTDFYKDKVKIKDNQKIYISPSGFDAKKFKRVKTDIREKYNIKSDEILIGSVGGIAKIRRLNEFLYIFKDVIKTNPKVKLMFIGEGDSLQELKDLTNKLNLNKNIIFVGKVPHNEIPKYMSGFDWGLCHLPNIAVYENSIPIKILEYLSIGIPVLASELKAHEELKKQLNGIFIYKNVGDILNIIKENRKTSLKNPNLKEFSWDTIIKRYEVVWRTER